MKISKSFIIYIHIIVLSLTAQNLIRAEDFSKNVIIHEKPQIISELKFKDSNLQDVDLINKRGKIMIINFWATWCAPCRKEMPSLDRLKALNDFKNFNIIPINIGGDSYEKSKKFFDEFKIENLEIFTGSGPEFSQLFKIRGLPTTILIDRNGFEVGRIVGYIDFNDQSLLEWLLKNL